MDLARSENKSDLQEEAKGKLWTLDNSTRSIDCTLERVAKPVFRILRISCSFLSIFALFASPIILHIAGIPSLLPAL